MVRASLPYVGGLATKWPSSHEGRSTKAQPERRSQDPPTVDPPRESTKPEPGANGGEAERVRMRRLTYAAMNNSSSDLSLPPFTSLPNGRLPPDRLSAQDVDRTWGGAKTGNDGTCRRTNLVQIIGRDSRLRGEVERVRLRRPN